MKKFLALMTVIFLLAVMTTTAYAAGSVSWKGPDTVRAGDTITLTFSAGGGIYGGQGSVSFDSSQLTFKKFESVIGGSWKVDYVESNGKFAFYDEADVPAAIESSKAIFKISFVVDKSLSEGTEISVSVKGVKLSDGSQDTSIGTKTYSAVIAPPLSDNCQLASLKVSNAKISPAFSPNVKSYTASVPFTTSKLELSADAEHPGAKVTVKNPTLTPGDTTTVSVTVKAENGDTKTYSIKVKRAQDPNYVPSANGDLMDLVVDGAQLSPAFAPDVTAYYVWLPYETEEVSISAFAADEKAKLEIGETTGLKPGMGNEIAVTVTAENGSQKVYTVTAVRAPAHEDTESFLAGDRPAEEPAPTVPAEPAPAQPKEPTMMQWGILAGGGALLLVLGMLLGILISKKRKQSDE